MDQQTPGGVPSLNKTLKDDKHSSYDIGSCVHLTLDISEKYMHTPLFIYMSVVFTDSYIDRCGVHGGAK